MEIKPLLGLGGVLIAAMTSEFNDQVTAVALIDVRGALGIGHDSGTWIESLYVSAEIIGMAISPTMMMAFTLRRWTLFAIALCGASSVLIPFSPNIEAIYTLRLLQGLAGGLIIPLLMTTALRVVTPNVRLYGLAVYALTATFTPALAATVSAFWTDIVDWRFVFLQTIPLCSLAGILIWYCLHQDQPNYERLRMLDWRGALLLMIGIAALSTMLYQGDRLDWFNSRLICVLALVSAVALSLLLINEWFHPSPLLKLQMLGRRNFAYGALGLFTFLVIGQSGSNVPLRYLQEVQGYRPLQSNLITLEIAASQLVMLPAMALLLDYKRVDARVVSLIGLALILASCIGSSFLTVYWNRDQFYLWQLLQAVGQPMVIMPLLMMVTNTVAGPAEGSFASAVVNTSRGLAEAASAWFLELINRWRDALHYDRIADEAGQDRWRVIQSNGVLPQYPPPLMPDGQLRTPNSLEAFSHAVEQQVAILSASDTFLILGALTVFLMVVVMTLPVRTVPPRILFAKH
ncbi:MFS transporter, DHA2 family, multidrug resistance protein [Bradyrhizobium lablabi]|uniref:MFS transporter, DHA2 family, multidrug resistance protein n=1 Tax=Bradyrhizobium lablabi TaxID=722472 RepID=A0A1M7DSE7_9BRAD|nr:MFS transporter [Bradyrhizobium lablabi]SHL82424.1 MFS transporter, DHA2 family, multidrug resistance protein [Bradyrhizobium lablabi]